MTLGLATLMGAFVGGVTVHHGVAGPAPETAPLPTAKPDTVPPAPPKTRAIAQAARVSGTRGWLVVDVDTGAVVDAFQPQAAFV
ncbi:MAG: hypothetical protein AAF675_15310, partial [Pseudomonadota bacterium]